MQLWSLTTTELIAQAYQFSSGQPRKEFLGALATFVKKAEGGKGTYETLLKAFLLFLGLAVALGAIGVWYFVSTGVSAKEKPGRVEEFIAKRVRNMAIARQATSLMNPVADLGRSHCRGTGPLRGSLRDLSRQRWQRGYADRAWAVAQGS